MAANEQPKKSFLRANMFGVGEHIPKIRELDVASVSPNPDQPRKFFDPEALDQLAASIAAKGLLQPILVKTTEDGSSFIIVAGERRFRAIQQVGWKTLPAIVTTGDTDEIALIENMQREGLQPIEEAEAVARLMKTHSYSLDDAAKTLGKSKATVSELLSLLKLPEEMRAAVRTSERQFSKSTLIELAKMEPEAQQAAWEAVKDGQGTLSVRAAREARKDGKTGEGTRANAGWIKGTVKGLYTFAKIARSYEGDVSEEDLEALKEAKRHADEAFGNLIRRSKEV